MGVAKFGNRIQLQPWLPWKVRFWRIATAQNFGGLSSIRQRTRLHSRTLPDEQSLRPRRPRSALEYGGYACEATGGRFSVGTLKRGNSDVSLASAGTLRSPYRSPVTVCTENLIRVDDVMESPKLVE